MAGIEEKFSTTQWDRVVSEKCPRCGERRRIAVKNDILGLRFRFQCNRCHIRVSRKSLGDLRLKVRSMK